MTDNSNIDAVIRKIQKLLSRTKEGRGATDEESDTAMKIVQGLMVKYNLDMATVDAAGGSHDDTASVRVEEHRRDQHQRSSRCVRGGATVMILALKNGALIPPASPAKGHKRALALETECARIEMQLRDKSRQRAYEEGKIPGSYESWKRKAEQALRMHNMELRLLTRWVTEQMVQMLQRAAEIIDEVDIEEDEEEFVKQLNEFVD